VEQVIASRERYEPRAKFQTFLYRIAHNCFVDYWPALDGSRGSQWRRAGRLARLVAAPDDERPTHARNLRRTVARYKAALADLPAEQRDVFFWYEESGPLTRGDRIITAVVRKQRRVAYATRVR